MNHSINDVIQNAHEQRSAFIAAAMKQAFASVKIFFTAKNDGQSSAELPHAV